MSNYSGVVRLHRVLRASPDKVYRAFIDAKAIEYWCPPHGFLGAIDRMDAREGGGYHMTFTNFTTQQSHAFTVTYVKLVPGQLIEHSDRFDDDNLPGEMQVTIALKPVACGTELSITQAGIPDVIPTEFCYLGWQESLLQLANLVEPEIIDEV